MKKRRMAKNITSGIMAVFIVSTLAAYVLGNNLQAPNETIIIDGKKPVKFNHSVHIALKLDCGTCHHDKEHQPLTRETLATLNADQLSCISCHNSAFSNKKLRKMKNIFHSRCRTCHKSGVGEKKGPTKCVDCHGKKTKKQVRTIEGC